MFNPEELAYKEPPKKRRFRFPGKRVFLFSTIFVLGISLGVGGFYGYQYWKAIPQAPAPDVPDAPPQQVLGLIETVEKKVPDIPKNEFPSVATVADLTTLSDQAFFEGAKEGDKIMIYTVAKRAILYRPSTNEVVRQGPVEIIGQDEDLQTEEASTSAVLSASDSAKKAPALRIKY